MGYFLGMSTPQVTLSPAGNFQLQGSILTRSEALDLWKSGLYEFEHEAYSRLISGLFAALPSESKAAAARVNGKLGGRPRKI